MRTMNRFYAVLIIMHIKFSSFRLLFDASLSKSSNILMTEYPKYIKLRKVVILLGRLSISWSHFVTNLKSIYDAIGFSDY